MFSTNCMRSAWRGSKRLKISNPVRPLSTSQPLAEEKAPQTTPAPVKANAQIKPTEPIDRQPKEWADRLGQIGEKFRLPRNVQAIYLKPLRREPEYGLPVCDLQLRSYSARHVEFFADFALRAAYYLNLPAFGPVPLPRITERWTVLKSNFAHKKAQENFERITMRRLIQIKDGNPEVVQAWLAFLRKHAYHGVGMKANVYDHCSLDVGKSMDETMKNLEGTIEKELSQFGSSFKAADKAEPVSQLVDRKRWMNNNSR